EGIVDDVSALQNRMFEVTAVVFDFMRNTIDDNAVFGGLIQFCPAKFDEFGSDAVCFSQLIDLGNEGRWKAVFASTKKADFFHGWLPNGIGLRRGRVRCMISR